MKHGFDINGATPVLVQGISGRAARLHTRLMREYGTNVVAGTSTSKSFTDTALDGVPVFQNCRDAVQASGAQVSIAMVPPLAVMAAVKEAIDAGIKLIVTVAEGVPVHDAMKIKVMADAAGVQWVGASTPGLCIPGKIKLGFLPNVSLLPGHIGVMSKSGTLSYEVCYRLVQRGIGQSAWIGVGGDLVKGTRFADLIPFFAEHEASRAIVVVGEIGGTEEEELAARMLQEKLGKPVFVLLAGSQAKEGVTMGHAGALVHGDFGTVETKRAALLKAHAQVFTNIENMVAAVESAL